MDIGRKIIHLASVDSTSNYVANLIKESEIDHGTVILADEQFAGRGQRDAEWLVKSGENLTFSIFVNNVNLSVDQQFYITQMVSLILIEFLSKYGIAACIKWPNDIYVNGKKIAGILIENQLSGSIIKSSIIGIGLNVNQLEFDGFNATSTYIEDNKFRNINEVLFAFINTFNNFWMDYSEEKKAGTKDLYLEKVYRFNEIAEYKDSNGPFSGRITDVLDSGALVIEKKGRTVHYTLKEITFLP